MQMVIIAGGLATRLKHLSAQIPKSLLNINNKPFLEYQIELLKKNNIKDIVLCVGHFSEQVKNYFQDGANWGVNIKYSDEGENLLGTGGALKKAKDLLQDNFFVMWGDSYLLVNYENIWNYYLKSNSLALMTVYKNFNLGDKSNVIIKDNKIILYNKWLEKTPEDMVYIDYGLLVLNKKILDLIPESTVYPLELIFKNLSLNNSLSAFIVNQKFYEIGSFNGLSEFEKFVTSLKQT